MMNKGICFRPVGASLGRVARIDTSAVPKALQDIELQVLTDVTNPLCGSQGATYIFGGQKGLNPLLFPAIDQAMQGFYQLVDARILSMLAPELEVAWLLAWSLLWEV